MEKQLTDDQLATLPPLTQRLILSVRSAGLRVDHRELFPDGEIVIPAASSEVGDLVIEADEEITLFVGHHTHGHFTPAPMSAGTDQEHNDHTIDMFLTYLRDILADQVVIWSLNENGRQRSGGTFGIEAMPSQAPAGADAWLWSGRRYEPVP